MTDDTKKDLTDIQELTQASQPSISHMAGKDVNPVMEEPKIETVDSFESFDEFQKSGFVEPPTSTASDTIPEMAATPTETVSEFPPMEESMTSMEHAPPSTDTPPTDSLPQDSTPSMNTTGLDMAESTHQDMSGIPGMGGSAPDFTPPTQDFSAPPFATQTESFQQPIVSQSPSATPAVPQGTQIIAGSTTESQLYPNPPSSFGDGQSATQILQAQVQSGLAGVKQRSENTNLMRGQTLQPFDFMMNGFLDPLNQSKFKDIVTKNKLGLTSDELDIQLKSGKIKLPKISEYAGVYLIQAFRDAAVDMRLIPVNDQDISQTTPDPRISAFLSDEGTHLTTSLSEQIPITSGEILPEFRDWEIVDTLTGSIGLTSEAIEVESTDLYTSAVEALKREMRLRAFHKGASAIILFSVSMVRLSIPTHYKIFAVGTAINRIGTG